MLMSSLDKEHLEVACLTSFFLLIANFFFVELHASSL